MQDVVLMQQVHGNNIARVTRNDSGSIIPNCDGLITNDNRVSLGVRVADCLPISVIDKVKNAKALIHAGWRGLNNGIIGKCINKLADEFGCDTRDLQVNIGPHICSKHYEVKNDVSGLFDGHKTAFKIKDGKIYMDLAEVALVQFVSSGVDEKNIRVDSHCTYENKKLHSYRRNKTEKRNLVTV